jgi:hypothetical protein
VSPIKSFVPSFLNSLLKMCSSDNNNNENFILSKKFPGHSYNSVHLYGYIVSLYVSYLLLNLNYSSLLYTRGIRFDRNLVESTGESRDVSPSYIYEYVIDLLKASIQHISETVGNSPLLINIMLLYFSVLIHRSKYVRNGNSIRKKWYSAIDEGIGIINDVNYLCSSSVGINMDSEDDIAINEVISRLMEEEEKERKGDKTEKEEDKIAEIRRAQRNEKRNLQLQLIEKEENGHVNDFELAGKEKVKKEGVKDNKKKRGGSDERKINKNKTKDKDEGNKENVEGNVETPSAGSGSQYEPDSNDNSMDNKKLQEKLDISPRIFSKSGTLIQPSSIILLHRLLLHPSRQLLAVINGLKAELRLEKVNELLESEEESYASHVQKIYLKKYDKNEDDILSTITNVTDIEPGYEKQFLNSLKTLYDLKGNFLILGFCFLFFNLLFVRFSKNEK